MKKRIIYIVFEYSLHNKSKLNIKYVNPKLSDDKLLAKCQQSICNQLNMVLNPTKPSTKLYKLTWILLEILYDHDTNSKKLIAN